MRDSRYPRSRYTCTPVLVTAQKFDEEEKIPVAGRVIWITPKGAQGKRTAGIGVQFSEQDQGNTQKRIENYLAGALGGDKPTHTL